MMNTTFKKVNGYFLMVILILGFGSCAETSNNSDDQSSIQEVHQENEPDEAAKETLEGAWILISGEYSGKTREKGGEPFQYKFFTDKHISTFMQRETGEWDIAAVGTYEIERGVYKENYIESNEETWKGTYVEWKFELKGDTLIMEGPLKFIDSEGVDNSEESGNLNNIREIRVRAK